jgi:hypothetical protein
LTAKVTTLSVRPGIQRDGTQFASDIFVDGEWVRFQRGVPRKIGGYNGIFLNASGISRGMTMTSENGLNYVISGYNNGLEQWTTDNDDGLGFGPTTLYPTGPITTFSVTTGGTSYTNGIYTSVALQGGAGTGALATITITGNVVVTATITTAGSGYQIGDILTVLAASVGGTGSGFTGTVGALSYYSNNNLNLWQLDIGYDSTGGANSQLIAHPGLNLSAIDNTTNTRPLFGKFPSTTFQMAPVGVFTAAGTTNSTTIFTLTTANSAVGAGLSITGSGIPAGTTVVSVVGTAVTMSAAATASASITATFDNNISISGGVVMLHPYLFVYGNNGLIQNCAAGDFNNWTSSDSNANNVATGKIVKGLPIRGGTTSPSGLFWSLDSVIRVSYSPTTVGGLTFYWRYDLLTSQTSIMSSQCVIEYDGIFYWCGVDRFLCYNGVVQEIPNTINQNYFFDNLNYAQRQKVWVSKVPRFGEIWWFYPKGDATECTDAIIYNVREKTWYDAGQSPGARRSAGAFSEVFRNPVWSGNEVNTQGKYTIWQHEKGVNQIYLTNVNAIRSMFETCNLGLVTGGPGNPQIIGDNLWARIDRIEPDFVQEGQMNVVVTGKGYANDDDIESAPYVFDPDTLKVDMREQRRELRLRFESNTQNGNYQMGKILISVEGGDVRSTGNP